MKTEEANQRFYFSPPTAPRKVPSTLRRLLVRCPTTSKLVATGESIDEPLWEGIAAKKGTFTCPHCTKVHSWVKKDVILAR